MLRIALVGAPSSGKTDLAHQIAGALSDRNVVVVDNYISEIENRSDVALSHFASYLGNLQAAIGRWEAERKTERDHKPDIMITCGTIIESAVYEAINALVHAELNDGAMTARALQNDKRASVTLTLFGIMAYDTYLYDYSFYLPLDEETKNDDGNKWNTSVDKHILESADAMNIKLDTLEDPAERLATIVTKIEEHASTSSE